MADSVSVSGPVNIQSDSKERVAFDLMVRIVNNESSVEKDRRYYLELFSQCRQIVHGGLPDKVYPPLK